MKSSKFDVVVLTVLDEEKDAVISVFKEKGTELEERVDIDNPVTAVWFEGSVGNKQVALVKILDKRNEAASAFVTRVIDHWNPSYLILTGIGGGVKEKVNLGDVVFPKEIRLFGEHREAGKVDVRPITVSSPDSVLREIAGSIKKDFNFKVHEGVVISTDAVINDPDDELLKRILDLHNEVLVFETEGGGVARAVYDTRSNKVPFLSVRGVSDFVNDFEGKLIRERWKEKAARHAAEFTFKIIEKLSDESINELEKYLAYVRSYFTKKSEIDGKAPEDYYVEPEMKICKVDSWNNSEEKISEDDIIKEWNYKKFLENDELYKLYTVIGAPFGTGKTTYLKYLAYTLSKERYVPVYIPLSGCESIYDADVYNGRNLEYVLKIAPESKVVLLLDGLDEFAGDIKGLMREVRKLNLKTIISTRLKSGYPDELDIKKYLRIFEFDEAKVKEFFNRYGVDVEYSLIENLNIKDMIGKPLFCWMLALSWDVLKHVKLEQYWSTNVKRALFYYIFTREIIKGKYLKSDEAKDFVEYYEHEKEFLRIAAALANMHERLKYDDLIAGIKEINPKLGEIVEEKTFGDPVLTTYFIMRSRTTGKVVEFLHKSFEEYFLAEYYYKNIRDGRKELMYAGVPSEETISFLKGLSEISRDNKLLKLLGEVYVEFQEILEFFNYKNFRENAKEFVESSDIVIPVYGLRETGKFKAIETENPAYGWLYKWICLCVLDEEDKKNIDVKILEDLIRFNLYIFPDYIKNLERAHLEEANLEEANLDGANLEEAHLEGAKLRRANLEEANLKGAHLWRANLEEANLKGANLEEAHLWRASLWRANLKGAHLEGAHLEEANLKGANLEEAHLEGANLKGAKFF